MSLDKDWLDLAPNEKKLWWEHKHIIGYTGTFISTLIMVIVAFVLVIIESPYLPDMGYYPLLLIPLAIGILMYQLVERKNHYYIMTTHKFVEKSGIISLNLDPLHYNRVVNIRANETRGERILHFITKRIPFVPTVNIGKIRISTAEHKEDEIVKYYVPKVGEVRNLIEHMKAEGGVTAAASSNFESSESNQNETSGASYPDQNNESDSKTQNINREDIDDEPEKKRQRPSHSPRGMKQPRKRDKKKSTDDTVQDYANTERYEHIGKERTVEELDEEMGTEISEIGIDDDFDDLLDENIDGGQDSWDDEDIFKDI